MLWDQYKPGRIQLRHRRCRAAILSSDNEERQCRKSRTGRWRFISIQAIFHGVATAMNRVCQTKSGSSSVLIFVIALAVRLLAISILSPHKAPQHYEIDRIAISFSRGDGLTNPFPTATGPSALYTPAYPLLLSIIYYLLGAGPEAELAKLLFNAIGSSLWLSLLPFASVAAGAGPLPGVTAGLFGAMLPLHLWTDLRGKDAP